MSTSSLQKFKNSKLSRLLAKLALTLLAFWLVFRNIDFSTLPDIFHKQKTSGLVAGILFLWLQMAVGGMRWRQILRALSERGQHVISKWEAYKLFYISVFFNGCLPGTVGGDVVRVWLAKSDNIPLQLSINSVVIDRLIALISLGILVTLTLPLFGSVAGFNPLPFLLLAAVGAAFGLWLLFSAEKLLAPWKEVRPINWILYLAHCMRLLLKHRGMTGLSILFAIFSHVSYALAAWSLSQSMDGTLTLVESITFMPWVLLITILPISIGGWGMREASMVMFLGMAGVPKAHALTISLELGLLAICMSLPAGLLWLGYRKNNPIQKEAMS